MYNYAMVGPEIATPTQNRSFGKTRLVYAYMLCCNKNSWLRFKSSLKKILLTPFEHQLAIRFVLDPRGTGPQNQIATISKYFSTCYFLRKHID